MESHENIDCKFLILSLDQQLFVDGDSNHMTVVLPSTTNNMVDWTKRTCPQLKLPCFSQAFPRQVACSLVFFWTCHSCQHHAALHPFDMIHLTCRACKARINAWHPRLDQDGLSLRQNSLEIASRRTRQSNGTLLLIQSKTVSRQFVSRQFSNCLVLFKTILVMFETDRMQHHFESQLINLLCNRNP